MACRGCGHGKSLCVIAKSWQHTQGYARPRERSPSGGLQNSFMQAALTLPGCCQAAGHMHCAICVRGITLPVLAFTLCNMLSKTGGNRLARYLASQSCAGACIPPS